MSKLPAAKNHFKLLNNSADQSSTFGCLDNPFCRLLTCKTRSTLCAMKSLATFRRKKEAFFRPDKERQLMLVRRGEIFTLREHQSGRQKAVESLAQGDIIGASHVFGIKKGLPIHMYVKDTAEVCVFPMDKFEAMMKHADFAHAFILNIVTRFAATLTQLEHMTMDDSEGKIIYVLEMRNQHDAAVAARSLPLTHRELALLAGINRITATRALEQLRGAGLFSPQRNKP